MVDNNIITIDGPAGSGKSTMAKMLAKKLGYSFLDTGAMYRAVAFACLEAGIDLTDKEAVKKVLDSSNFDFAAREEQMKIFLNGKEIDAQLRSVEVTESVKFIAPLAFIRDYLVKMQRQFAQTVGKVVSEGRDQGTMVFPKAKLKIYLTADVKERARRRYSQLKESGEKVDLKEIEKAIERRDKADMQREISPLRKADDAIEVDTSDWDIQQSVDKLIDIALEAGLKVNA